MTVQSDTKTIDTNNEYVTVESVTDITFTSGTIYTIQISNFAYLKIGNAVFQLRDQVIQYKAGSDDLYIRTPYTACTIAILEEESA